MSLDTNSILMALGAGVLALLGVLAARALSRVGRLGRRVAALESELAGLRAEVAAAAGIGVRVGERLRRLEPVAAQLSDRLGQLEVRGDGRPYDHAIAFVRHGADADRLVAQFGLSRGEADLVARVHGRRRAG